MCAQVATAAHMTHIASRDLHNHTGDVLRRVADGERITVTRHGRPVAEIAPLSPPGRPVFFTRAELAAELGPHQADSRLRDELAVLAGDTTDDLGPVR
jgi:prevent-host-death family protein